MSTNVLSAKQIHRKWHIVDAKGKVLGRVATEVATKLMGKHKAQYIPYLDLGDFVVVTNAAQVKISGRKSIQKKYVRHSGFPGGLRVDSFSKVIFERPEYVLTHAIKGMLPKTRLGRQMVKKLHIFKDAEHPFKKQLAVEEDGTSNK